MANEIKYFVSPLTTDKYLSHNSNCMNAFPFDKISDDELVSDLDKHKTHTSVLDKIHELNNLIQDEDRDDGSILTDIDPDLNMLYNMMILLITLVNILIIVLSEPLLTNIKINLPNVKHYYGHGSILYM